MSVLHQLRRTARHLGVEVVRAEPMTVWRLRLPELLRLREIDIVLDVGANDGGYASELIENGYQGRIVSFEPLPDAWECLRQRALKLAPERWTVGPRIALSDHDGEAEFHEAGNSVSSSLLRMTGEHVAAAPNSATIRTHKVPIRRLDDVLGELDVGTGAFLKLDVQGAESLVLAGANDSLGDPIRGLQLEMSLSNLYEGQELANDLDASLRARGFRLWDILPGFRNPRTLRLMQYDGIYFHESSR